MIKADRSVEVDVRSGNVRPVDVHHGDSVVVDVHGHVDRRGGTVHVERGRCDLGIVAGYGDLLASDTDREGSGGDGVTGRVGIGGVRLLVDDLHIVEQRSRVDDVRTSEGDRDVRCEHDTVHIGLGCCLHSHDGSSGGCGSRSGIEHQGGIGLVGNVDLVGSVRGRVGGRAYDSVGIDGDDADVLRRRSRGIRDGAADDGARGAGHVPEYDGRAVEVVDTPAVGLLEVDGLLGVHVLPSVAVGGGVVAGVVFHMPVCHLVVAEPVAWVHLYRCIGGGQSGEVLVERAVTRFGGGHPYVRPVEHGVVHGGGEVVDAVVVGHVSEGRELGHGTIGHVDAVVVEDCHLVEDAGIPYEEGHHVPGDHDVRVPHSELVVCGVDVGAVIVGRYVILKEEVLDVPVADVLDHRTVGTVIGDDDLPDGPVAVEGLVVDGIDDRVDEIHIGCGESGAGELGPGVVVASLVHDRGQEYRRCGRTVDAVGEEYVGRDIRSVAVRVRVGFHVGVYLDVIGVGHPRCHRSVSALDGGECVPDGPGVVGLDVVAEGSELVVAGDVADLVVVVVHVVTGDSGIDDLHHVGSGDEEDGDQDGEQRNGAEYPLQSDLGIGAGLDPGEVRLEVDVLEDDLHDHRESEREDRRCECGLHRVVSEGEGHDEQPEEGEHIHRGSGVPQEPEHHVQEHEEDEPVGHDSIVGGQLREREVLPSHHVDHGGVVVVVARHDAAVEGGRYDGYDQQDQEAHARTDGQGEHPGLLVGHGVGQGERDGQDHHDEGPGDQRREVAHDGVSDAGQDESDGHRDGVDHGCGPGVPALEAVDEGLRNHHDHERDGDLPEVDPGSHRGCDEDACDSGGLVSGNSIPLRDLEGPYQEIDTEQEQEHSEGGSGTVREHALLYEHRAEREECCGRVSRDLAGEHLLSDEVHGYACQHSEHGSGDRQSERGGFDRIVHEDVDQHRDRGHEGIEQDRDDDERPLGVVQPVVGETNLVVFHDGFDET